jgi:hypothetical protein
LWKIQSRKRYFGFSDQPGPEKRANQGAFGGWECSEDFVPPNSETVQGIRYSGIGKEVGSVERMVFDPRIGEAQNVVEKRTGKLQKHFQQGRYVEDE